MRVRPCECSPSDSALRKYTERCDSVYWNFGESLSSLILTHTHAQNITKTLLYYYYSARTTDAQLRLSDWEQANEKRANKTRASGRVSQREINEQNAHQNVFLCDFSKYFFEWRAQPLHRKCILISY